MAAAAARLWQHARKYGWAAIYAILIMAGGTTTVAELVDMVMVGAAMAGVVVAGGIRW